ncbi:hypothetical protein Aeq9CBH6_11860 [Adlercreutzia equolifaciens]|nr:hypothetical protein Aeq9CBH6_11860 [Adlercreutzia equolifaciens]
MRRQRRLNQIGRRFLKTFNNIDEHSVTGGDLCHYPSMSRCLLPYAAKKGSLSCASWPYEHGSEVRTCSSFGGESFGHCGEK